MARKPRLEFEGASYHVINRGNYRRVLFSQAGSAASFEKTLFEACEKYGWQLHAYVVMSNHFHLALETPEPNLSVGMQWLQGTFATRFNRFHGEVGKPFQGRFKALLVEPGRALAQVAHYIHLNPVRAKRVSADRVIDHPWSSLPKFVHGRRPSFLVAADILAAAGGLADTKAGWQRYLQYLAWLATDQAAQKEARFMEMSRGWCIGTQEYREALKQDFAARAGPLRRRERASTEAEAWHELREAQWEAALRRAAKASGIGLAELPAAKSAKEKVRLAAVMKAATSVSNGWLANRLQMGEPASVSQFVRRFRLAGLDRSRRHQAALSKVKL